jgi:hypothetical protein
VTNINHSHLHGQIVMIPPDECEEQHYSENSVVQTTETREPNLR